MLVSGDLKNLKYSLHRNGDFNISFGYRDVSCSMEYKSNILNVLCAGKTLLYVNCDYSFFTGVGLLVKLQGVYVTSEERVINFLSLVSFEDNFIKAMNLNSGSTEIIYPSGVEENDCSEESLRIFSEIICRVLASSRTNVHYSAAGGGLRVYTLGNYRLLDYVVEGKFILQDINGNLIAMTGLDGFVFGEGCTKNTLVGILKYVYSVA